MLPSPLTTGGDIRMVMLWHHAPRHRAEGVGSLKVMAACSFRFYIPHLSTLYPFSFRMFLYQVLTHCITYMCILQWCTMLTNNLSWISPNEWMVRQSGGGQLTLLGCLDTTPSTTKFLAVSDLILWRRSLSLVELQPFQNGKILLRTYANTVKEITKL